MTKTGRSYSIISLLGLATPCEGEEGRISSKTYVDNNVVNNNWLGVPSPARLPIATIIVGSSLIATALSIALMASRFKTGRVAVSRLTMAAFVMPISITAAFVLTLAMTTAFPVAAIHAMATQGAVMAGCSVTTLLMPTRGSRISMLAGEYQLIVWSAMSFSVPRWCDRRGNVPRPSGLRGLMVPVMVRFFWDWRKHHLPGWPCL